MKTDLLFRSKSKNLKLEIGSHKNQPYFDVKMWRYRVDVLSNLPKYPVRVSMLYRYRYHRRYRRHTGTGGTGIDVVPNVPKCEVPVLMSYRAYRSVRYRY